MPATGLDAKRITPDDHPDRREDAEARDAAVRQWSEMAVALHATDEDDVPLFGRLPA